MNRRLSYILISLTILFAVFTTAGFARADTGKDDAVKDRGTTMPSYIPGCSLKITNADVNLYSNRSLQGIVIAKAPRGNYRPLDYRKGWYKVRARGWIAWILDSRFGTLNTNFQKRNCPEQN